MRKIMLGLVSFFAFVFAIACFYFAIAATANPIFAIIPGIIFSLLLAICTAFFLKPNLFNKLLPQKQKQISPDVPNVSAPIQPQTAADAPASPEADTPASPEADTPANPEADTPANPEADTLASPEADTPTSPEAHTPANPEADAPASPEADTPASPEADTPANPEADDPASPEADASASPEADAPTSPEADTPANPEADTPESPSPAPSQKQAAPLPKAYMLTLDNYKNFNGKRYKCEYRYIVDIVGSQSLPDQTPIAEWMEGSLVKFEFAPNNPHDSDAVVILDCKGRPLGYIPKGNLQEMIHDFTRRGQPVLGRIHSACEGKIDVACYQEAIPKMSYAAFIDSDKPRKTYRLTGNTSQEMQDAIGLSADGERVSFSHDLDKDKYMVSNAYAFDIGYLPKAADGFAKADEYEAFIDTIEEDANEKYIVKIVIFPEA